MATTLRLTVLSGPHRGTRFCLREKSNCVIGRAPDCAIRICGAERDRCISRHHCQLYFDPPLVRVQDLGSSNGTFINGLKPGRSEGEPAADWFQPGISIGLIRDGDILTLGGFSMQANLMECPPKLDGQFADKSWQENEVVKTNCEVAC